MRFAPRITKAEKMEWIGSTVYTDLQRDSVVVVNVYLRKDRRVFVVRFNGRNRHLDETQVST